MTTEEKLDALIDTVNCFAQVLLAQNRYCTEFCEKTPTFSCTFTPRFSIAFDTFLTMSEN